MGFAMAETRIEAELKRLGDGIVALRDEWALDPASQPFAARLHEVLCGHKPTS